MNHQKKNNDHPLHSSMTVAPATPQFSTPSTPNLGLPTKTRWRFARVSVSGCARAAVVKFQPSKVFSCSWPKSPPSHQHGKSHGGGGSYGHKICRILDRLEMFFMSMIFYLWSNHYGTGCSGTSKEEHWGVSRFTEHGKSKPQHTLR